MRAIGSRCRPLTKAHAFWRAVSPGAGLHGNPTAVGCRSLSPCRSVGLLLPCFSSLTSSWQLHEFMHLQNQEPVAVGFLVKCCSTLARSSYQVASWSEADWRDASLACNEKESCLIRLSQNSQNGSLGLPSRPQFIPGARCSSTTSHQ